MGSIEDIGNHFDTGDSGLFIKSEVFTEQERDEDNYNYDWTKETFVAQPKEESRSKNFQKMKFLRIIVKNLTTSEVAELKADLKTTRFCTKCGKKFKNEKYLKKHVQNHHSGKRIRRHKCTKCEKSFYTNAHLVEHLNRHEGLRYGCSVCEKSYTDKSKVTHHMRIAHSSDTKKKISIKIIYSGKTQIVRNTTRPKIPLPEVEGKICPICSKSFTRNFVLKTHLLTHMENRPKYSCEYCGKELMSRQSLEEHVRIHTGERPFKCEICEKTFYSKKFLSTHQKYNHDDFVKSDCKICGKTYSSIQYLVKHMKKAHSSSDFILPSDSDDTTIIKCKFCSKILKFCEKAEHEAKVHSGPNPFCCEICSKYFEKKSNLIQHIKIHKGKPFECGECGNKFNRKYQLKVHMKSWHGIKTLYNCEKCGKKYSNARNLRNHENSHSGIRFECEFCDKSYVAKYNLDSHKLKSHKNKAKKITKKNLAM